MLLQITIMMAVRIRGKIKMTIMMGLLTVAMIALKLLAIPPVTFWVARILMVIL